MKQLFVLTLVAVLAAGALQAQTSPAAAPTDPQIAMIAVTSFPAAACAVIDSRREMFADWKTPNEEGVVYYLDKGRVRGVLLWNVWEQVKAARKLIAEAGPFTAQNLKGRLPT